MTFWYHIIRQHIRYTYCNLLLLSKIQHKKISHIETQSTLRIHVSLNMYKTVQVASLLLLGSQEHHSAFSFSSFQSFGTLNAVALSKSSVKPTLSSSVSLPKLETRTGKISNLHLSNSADVSNDVNSGANVEMVNEYTPIFDFSGKEADKLKSISSFERIDDAIMGGISLSALKNVEGQPYASWSGICRTDGG